VWSNFALAATEDLSESVPSSSQAENGRATTESAPRADGVAPTSS
jgi:hypothetical protein